MKIKIERFVVGPLETNTYLVIDEDSKNGIIVDPSSGCDKVIDYISQNKINVENIILTHGHFDHIMGIPEITKVYPNINVRVHSEDKVLLVNYEYNGSILINEKFEYLEPVAELNEGDCKISEISLEVRHVPGHSPGGCIFVIGKNCICGDSIFPSSIGRTDFPLCDGNKLLESIKNKILTLPEDTVLYPGHMGRTTVGREKRMNPFLQ